MNKDASNLVTFKIVLMGASGLGKTSIMNRYISGSFNDKVLASIEIGFSSKILNILEFEESIKIDVTIKYLLIIKIQIWDTAGQEKFKSITKIYYQKSDAIILVFDITNINTFNALQKLYEDIKQTIDVSKVLFFVVGNKNDLYENEEVTKEEAINYAKSINAEYMCVSALKPSGIEELFEAVGTKLLKKEKSEQNENEVSLAPSSTILDKDNKKKGKNAKKNCC